MNKMKTVIVLFSISLAGLSLGALLGMTPSNNVRHIRANSMKPLKVNDLSKYGLSIVEQSDSTFDNRLSATFGTESGRFNDILKRFSIFVVNNNDKAVVALAVNWEFVQADGQTISKYKAVRQFNLFGNNLSFLIGSASGALPQIFSRPIIEPHSSHLFSLIETGVLEKNSIGSVGGTFRADMGNSQNPNSTAMPNEIHQKIEKFTEMQASDLAILLEKSKSWSVSIDGAFFEDGSFVGPDKKSFFETIKAEQDAKFDLLMEIEKFFVKTEDKQQVTNDEIFNHIQTVAEPDTHKVSRATGTDSYKHSKSFYVKQLLGGRRQLSDERILGVLREEMKKPRVKLIKLVD